MISIVIPLYNKEKQIENTLRSVFSQTFQDFEIVIVDDGSTDNSANIVRSINDKRIRFIEQKNHGVSMARNIGIQVAKYESIAFLDADDEWKPDYLETQIGLIHCFPECRVFACAYEFKRDEKLTPVILNKIPFKGEKGVLTNYFEVASCSHPPLWTSAVVVKKEAILSIGGFPKNVTSGEDLLTWARLAVKYKIAYSRKVEAIFVVDQSHEISATPSRPHDENDSVGDGLTRLYQDEKHPTIKKQLKKYLSLWYKMRASVYLRLADKKNTIRYSFQSLKYDKTNFKVYLFMIMVLLPKKLQQIIKKQYNP
ncbi:MAG: glycosyltransferase [Candidatus Symbiothrix sp.]|jgi:glycosyltransferase involved in cell wall biosynthesis|nr:glycosyltransferase [Candidatus Symbiothrix sp.]